MSDIIVKGTEVVNLFDSPLLLCKNIGLNFEQRIMKRLMDVVISGLGLVITSPIMLITAISIKCNDGGPVFFKQDRCTLNGKVFSIYKFRSMIVDAEKDGKSRPALEDDDRITKVGKIIRKTRIDELPQLLNILKGEMSFVGPRPERIEHIEKYCKEIPEFSYRLKMKGGLTGYAQVYGRYNTAAYDKLKMDLLYIVNYSVLMDIQIIFETVKILFKKESTEGFSKQQIEQTIEKAGKR
ncbi:MAG: sugar transferase [Acetatifactor sp.]|nr:sugar transferase [Acetatifactor sp.]